MYKRTLFAVDWIVKQILVTIFWFYRHFISPVLLHHCRFTPSCSIYASEALQLYGGLRGFYLLAKRILRCHPFHPGGYDPLPACPPRHQSEQN